ncbi:hypothetical protein IR501_004353 [Salmonella enterica]|nr:hypothetical protein [Salmonella enterica]EHM5585929.1 hypothetical protein [Salmonella enterica subsp. enterica serovar Poona]EAT6761916.1 hypothetical protein [Salmonella enterica]EBS9581674.1 hypothetical protein [Salmonella enterica]ECL4349407.1 hypothetical protein [Salmonella enterica]
MTRENKKRLAILVMYIARIVGQSLRDVPLVLLIAGFLFLLFAPPTAWMDINQIWYHLRPLTDREAVMLGKSVSGLLQLAWLVAASSRFILSVDELSSRMKEVKDDR